MRMECPRCAAVVATRSQGSPDREPGFAIEEAPAAPRRPTAAQESLAAYLAGAFWFAVGGIVIGGRISGGQPIGLGIGALAGIVVGLWIGSKIARFESMIGAGVVCGLIPIFLCLKDAFRRGRLRLDELATPGFLVPFGIIFGSGFLVGALLVGTKKLILRATSH
jgi:hypothetical protein